MRALIIKTGTIIEPFGDDAGDAMVLEGTLRGQVDAALRELKIEPRLVRGPREAAIAEDEPVLVLADRLFVSAKALRDFLRAAPRKGPEALALRRTPSVSFTLPVSGVRAAALPPAEREQRPGGMRRLEREAAEWAVYDCFLVRGRDLPPLKVGQELLDALRDKCRPVVVAKKELTVPVRLPVIGDQGVQVMPFPITSTLCCEVRHWVHVLWLNQIGFGMRWMDLLRAHKLWFAWRALTAFPWRRDRVFQRLVRKGRGCRIHPTAHVELSVLGDNVTIGPRASVRNCVVGDGAHIGDHAVCLSSTLGAGAFVTHKTFVVWCAIYPGATVGNLKLQVSLVGRDAHVNHWAGFVDAKFKGAVRVERDGQFFSTERAFLGSCVGHRAVVASKIMILPGRAIPNDAVVVMRPDEIVTEIPKGLPPGEPLVRDHGTLVPLAQLTRPG